MFFTDARGNSERQAVEFGIEIGGSGSTRFPRKRSSAALKVTLSLWSHRGWPPLPVAAIGILA
jgi:hypothetical protein